MGRFDKVNDELHTVFEPSNEVSQAIRVIQYIKRKRPAAEYSTQFQPYAVKTDKEDDALIALY